MHNENEYRKSIRIEWHEVTKTSYISNDLFLLESLLQTFHNYRGNREFENKKECDIRDREHRLIEQILIYFKNSDFKIFTEIILRM